MYATYKEAFADYAIAARPSLEQIRSLPIRRGARYELSVGAFHGDEMVAFVIPELTRRGAKRFVLEALQSNVVTVSARCCWASCHGGSMPITSSS